MTTPVPTMAGRPNIARRGVLAPGAAPGQRSPRPGRCRPPRRPLFLRKFPFRPDWEAVITPIVDYLQGRPDVDTDRTRHPVPGRPEFRRGHPSREAAPVHQIAAYVHRGHGIRQLHCAPMAPQRRNQVIFDWLAETPSHAASPPAICGISVCGRAALRAGGGNGAIPKPWSTLRADRPRIRINGFPVVPERPPGNTRIAATRRLMHAELGHGHQLALKASVALCLAPP